MVEEGNGGKGLAVGHALSDSGGQESGRDLRRPGWPQRESHEPRPQTRLARFAVATANRLQSHAGGR